MSLLCACDNSEKHTTPPNSLYDRPAALVVGSRCGGLVGKVELHPVEDQFVARGALRDEGFLLIR